ncbi:MAG: restriction endonuclease subunit S [Oscillospiraceae bacterium]|nr:restriction endonuclease subunit S [Oscillospiraceae bacterium]
MKKPKIRFKGYTDVWEQRKLGDIVKVNGRIGFRGYTKKDIISKEADGILTFSPTNIIDNKLTTDCKNTYITRYKYDESPEIQVHNGDILFVKTGSTLGKSALITGLSEEATLNPQIVVMRVKSGVEKFLSTALITDNILKQVNSSKIGGAVPTLTETKIKEFSISLPTSNEEKKQIGNYFRHLDHLITLHQRKCDEAKKLKKFMLQKMFPQNGKDVPEIRFSGFVNAWEQRKVTELGEIYIGLVTTMTSHYTDRGSLLIRNSDIKDGYFEFGNNPIYLDEEFSKLNSSRKHKVGDVITVHTGDIGTSAVISEKEADSIGFATIVTRPNKEIIISEYLCTYLNTDTHKQFAMNISTGDGRNNYNLKDYYECIVPVPKVEEQKKIASIVQNLNHLITLHQRKCDNLKRIKKFMLQNMFV